MQILENCSGNCTVQNVVSWKVGYDDMPLAALGELNMTSITFLSLPIVLTASLFLILYNNTYNGRLILFIALLFNMSILLIPVKRTLFKSGLPWARLSSLCLIDGIAAILALDVLFSLGFAERVQSNYRLVQEFHALR
jgi:hypothetical protein